MSTKAVVDFADYSLNVQAGFKVSDDTIKRLLSRLKPLDIVTLETMV